MIYSFCLITHTKTFHQMLSDFLSDTTSEHVNKVVLPDQLVIPIRSRNLQGLISVVVTANENQNAFQNLNIQREMNA